jgi:hypothetical protein
MKTYAFVCTKHLSNELYIRQECLNTLISKTSDEKKIRIWQSELDRIEIEIAEFEWYMAEQTKQEQWQKKNYVRTLIICLILFMPGIIMGIVGNIRTNEVLKEAEKPYVFKKTNHTQKLHNVK